MAGLLDLLSGNGGQLTPQQMGLLGMAAQMSNAFAPQPASRLPLAKPNGAYLLGQAAGGYGGGYAAGLKAQQQALQNQMTGLQLGFTKDLYGNIIPGILGGSPQGSAQPQAAPATVPMAFKNGGQAAQATPAAAAPASVANRAQALGLLGGLMGNKALVDYAGQQQEYNPVLQGQIASAKSPLAVDIANAQAAKAVGDLNAAVAWQTKALYDSQQMHTASWSGTTTRIGPNGQIISSFNPSKGTIVQNGQMTPMPGAIGTTQALAAAQGGGEQAGKTAYSPQTYQLPTATGTPGQPGYLPAGTQMKALGAQVYPGLGFGGAVPGVGAASVAPRATSSALPGVVSEIAPTSEALAKGAGDQAVENNKAFQTEAELAKDQNAQIDSIRNAAATFGSGKFAQFQSDMLNYLNSAGLISKDQLTQLGAAQEGTKIAIQLQAAATRVLGAREAAQIFQWMGKSMPNLEMSPPGLEKVSAFMKGMNDYKIARAQVAQQRFNQNDAVGVNSTRDTFIQKSNPLYFIMADSSPQDRVEYLRNMGPNRAKQFVTGWDTAVKSGLAPGIGGSGG